MRRLDLTGKRFGRLFVLSYSHTVKPGYAYWLCRCDCGTLRSVVACNLSRGITKSCGCLRASPLSHGHTSGGRHTPTYRSWYAMIQRCTNPRNHKYRDYGGRGISVCKRWRSFENFLADMGERPAGLTLDRRDNDGSYEPGNCRWATSHEQARNKRPWGSASLYP